MRHGLMASLAFLFAACAGPEEIAKQPVAGRFESALSARQLAGCIDANGWKLGWGPGIYRSKMRDTGDEPIIVVVEDSANRYAVVAIVSVTTHVGGSAAEFRFRGLGGPTGIALNRLVADCG